MTLDLLGRIFTYSLAHSFCRKDWFLFIYYYYYFFHVSSVGTRRLSLQTYGNHNFLPSSTQPGKTISLRKIIIASQTLG